MLRDIIIWPDPVLKRSAERVTAFDESLRTLVADMFETMYSADGVGLAAPQIGLLTNITCAVWVFGFRWPHLRPHFTRVDFTAVSDLMSVGWKFLVIGAVWMVNSETDNLVIARYLGAVRTKAFRLEESETLDELFAERVTAWYSLEAPG